MVKTEKGFTSVRRYDDWANYNADTERTETTISLIQQDHSIVIGGKRFSQNAECYVGNNTSGISTTGNWFLCGEATLSVGHDVNIFGSVQQTLSSGALGLFALGLGGDSSAATLKTFQWLSKIGGGIPQLRIVINGFSVKLYCKVFGGQYNYGCVRLYHQGGRYDAVIHAKSYFKLANTDVIIPEADVPSGTDITDVPYLLKDGTAASATKVVNKLSLIVNGSTNEYDGSVRKIVNIKANSSHFVKASMYGESWTSPPAGATTPGIPIILDTSYMIPFGTLQDGDTIVMQVPTTLTSQSSYPVYLRLDTTEGNVAGNLVKLIKAQNAGNPIEWKGTTAITAGYYHFVYSEGAGGLIYMYRNVSTS